VYNITMLSRSNVEDVCDSVWHGDHRRSSYRLRHDGHVWVAVGDRRRRLSAHHHPAVCSRSHRAPA